MTDKQKQQVEEEEPSPFDTQKSEHEGDISKQSFSSHDADDLLSDNYCSMWYFLTLWGEAPLQA